MQTLKNGFFLVVGLVVVAWSFYMFLQQPAPAKYQRPIEERQVDVNHATLRIRESTLPVEVAETDAARTIGLSGREALAATSGLLFIFDEAEIYGFWMKDMKFPIDIIWINESWEVVDIDREVSPATFPTVFYPSAAVKYVLELNSGEASILGIDIGSKLFLDR